MQQARAIRHTHHAGKETTMGDGVSGAGNAPANQPTNRSGDTSAADAATKAKFDQALKQESCPEGLTRQPPKDCNYLRPPGQPPQPSKPIDLKIHGDPDRFKGPMSPRSDGPDLTKPIPKKPDSSLKLPDTRPFHDTTPSGTHVIGIEGKI
jgi:hypothetical protein